MTLNIMMTVLAVAAVIQVIPLIRKEWTWLRAGTRRAWNWVRGVKPVTRARRAR